ncbi:MAG: hypothetical protein BWY15_02111 [Firmicutes bacterium ADurb.Bin193]|nr:MAG: hypothetical protein BWY15_02111 [Firmicutes bacterium ADurb.Bin193]
MTYEEQLQTWQWKEKREHIISRDFGICQHCMSSKNLNVHHKVYIEGRMAWDYADAYLITLCQECHSKQHENLKIPVLEHGDVIVEAGARIQQSVWALKELAKQKP